MAGGDLGGLFFSLGVKDNVSRELDKLMTKFINMDASVNKTADSLKKLSDNIKLSIEIFYAMLDTLSVNEDKILNSIKSIV